MEVQTAALAKYMYSVCGVLTKTSIYSSSGNTPLIVLHLAACTQPLSMFCIIPPGVGCCSLHLIQANYI